jgi:hypothetical protein
MEGIFQNHEQDEAGHADGVHAHAGPKQACGDPRVSYPLEKRVVCTGFAVRSASGEIPLVQMV